MKIRVSMIKFILGAIPKIFYLFLFLDFLFRFRMIQKTLLINHILKYFLCWLEIIPFPIKRFLTNRLKLIIMNSIKIWMTLNSIKKILKHS